MSDLINRLRETASKGVSVWGDLQMEAAEEIEILTAEREGYASAMDRMTKEIEALRAEVNKWHRGAIGLAMGRTFEGPSIYPDTTRKEK